jgi:hypothetical protein
VLRQREVLVVAGAERRLEPRCGIASGYHTGPFGARSLNRTAEHRRERWWQARRRWDYF